MSLSHSIVAKAAALVGISLLIAVISALQVYLNWASFGDTVPYTKILYQEVLEWGMWAVAVPMIIMVERGAGFHVRSIAQAAAVHLTAATAWFAVQNAVLIGFSRGFLGQTQRDFSGIFLERAIFKYPSSVLVYSFILAIYLVVHLAMERHREEIRRVTIEAELSEAQLQNLKMQVHPHFLFNTMNTIAAFVRDGARAEAVEMMSELCDLLRRALRDVELQEVSLEDELDFLRRYVRIQEIRFGDRLRVQISVDEGIRKALVPNMILQPLVENAIQHGLDLENDGGVVEVSAFGGDGKLVLEIMDNGHGIPDIGAKEGIGLGTTRRRLQHLYHGNHQLEMSSAVPRGTRVRIELPLRYHPVTSRTLETFNNV